MNKFQIDTDEKIITVEPTTTVGEVLSLLQRNDHTKDDWREYTIKYFTDKCNLTFEQWMIVNSPTIFPDPLHGSAWR